MYRNGAQCARVSLQQLFQINKDSCVRTYTKRVTTITHCCSRKHMIENCPKHGTYQKQTHTHTHLHTYIYQYYIIYIYESRHQRTVIVDHIKPATYNTQNILSHSILYWIFIHLNIMKYYVTKMESISIH